ncbi:MAG TPA: transglutaminaseTgpA domain-containing protein [Acidimicrobiia bacterium]|nr:transglutaminaseTgpA domain-containing protein [Acidimicrobiia bacterium]
MARRLGWFVGLAALMLVMARLDRVLEPAVDTPDWRLIVPVAALGGVLVTWATSRLSTPKQLVSHLVGLIIVVLRVTAPDTLSYGIVPGGDTLGALAERLAYAFEILRFGAPPVLAVAGLAALTAMAMWCVAAVWAWSVTGARTWAGIVTPLGFYLYLAVVDRAGASLPWNVALAVISGLGLVATSNVVPSGAGHLRSTDHRVLPRWEAGPGGRLALGAALAGLVGVGFLGSVVPAGGAMNWRTPGGEGSGTGSGFSVSRFVGLRQSILSLSDDPVFRATVEPGVPEGPGGYWRVLTLDRYNGEEWSTGDEEFGDLDSGIVDRTAASTSTIVQTMVIESLREDRLPALYAPTRVSSNDPVIRSGVSVGTDGSLLLSAPTFDGLLYAVESQVPNVDLAALATEDGELTPMFAEAAAAGDFTLGPTDAPASARPAEIGSYLSIPETVDSNIRELANDVTADASTPFEAALLLEDFLQGFQYDTDVSTGHSSLDLAAWLTDPESPNYRRGYCEQFAAAMAVMGRLANLPTRVVIGFTTGERSETADGRVNVVVRERNAHAWVEVWLDGQGWVGFDPTPRADGATAPLADRLGFDPGALELAGEEDRAGVDPGAPDISEFPGGLPIGADEPASPPRSTGDVLPWLIGIVMVLAAAGALPILKLTRTRRRRRQAREGDVEAVWREITDRLVDLGGGPLAHQTPIEFAESTARELVPLAHAYSSAIYGGRDPGDVTLHLTKAEFWIEDTFDRQRRTRAAFSTRSLNRKA